MKNNNKILFVIPDGVGIRNYLFSNIVVMCIAKANLHFYTPLNSAAFSEIDTIDKIEITPFTFDKENNVTRLL